MIGFRWVQWDPVLLFTVCGCSERDEFEQALSHLRKEHTCQDSAYQAAAREREQLSTEVLQ